MPGAPSVPCSVTRRSSSPGSAGAWPSLKMHRADRAGGLGVLRLDARTSQVPRCMSATLPAVKPAKSAGSQPLVEVFGGLSPIGTTTSTACELAR